VRIHTPPFSGYLHDVLSGPWPNGIFAPARFAPLFRGVFYSSTLKLLHTRA